MKTSWITKYALSTGIFPVEAECCERSPSMIVVGRGVAQTYYHKPFWHSTREEAVAHANEMRMRKIKSIQKQLKKLERPIE